VTRATKWPQIWLCGLVAGVCIPLAASAATVVCAGTVITVSYHASGVLMIRLSSMNVPVFFCTPDSTWTTAGPGLTTEPEACKAMYATFLAARLSGTPLANVYFDGDAVPAACNAWSAWTNANIRHYLF
jgi:hypothetical protein